MALFSWGMQIIGRSSGRSAVAAAAYRAGELLHDARTGVNHDYRRREGVEHRELLLPGDAPSWTIGLTREKLWNAVEATEKRKDSQLCRELRVMIPREVPREERIEVLRDYVVRSFVAKGMVADVCWHNKVASDGLEQPHAHVMLTMRPLADGGFGPKSRHDWVPDPTGRRHDDGRPVLVVSDKSSWNSPEYFDQCRENWELTANAALERAGSDERIDRRSLLERGLLRLPEPMLRAAWYLKDLHGAMKDRFGQYLVAKHYQSVERAAKTAFQRIESSDTNLGHKIRTAERFYNWFERQLDRLTPAPKEPAIEPSQDRER